MGIFGWSYPPGCSGPPGEAHDDEHCSVCGTKLDEEPRPYSWHDYGFCNLSCALDWTGNFRWLHGEAALELAKATKSQGGPAFGALVDLALERVDAPDEIRLGREPAGEDWIERNPNRPITYEDRIERNNKWAWRLWAGQECLSLRLTTRRHP